MRPTAFIVANPEEHYAELKSGYILSKSAEVLFQQVCLYILYAFVSYSASLLLLGVVVFTLMHSCLRLFYNTFWTVFYTAAAMIDGGIFVALYLYVESGVVWAFMIHLGFYFCAGLYVWMCLPRRAT